MFYWSLEWCQWFRGIRNCCRFVLRAVHAWGRFRSQPQNLLIFVAEGSGYFVVGRQQRLAQESFRTLVTLWSHLSSSLKIKSRMDCHGNCSWTWHDSGKKTESIAFWSFSKKWRSLHMSLGKDPRKAPQKSQQKSTNLNATTKDIPCNSHNHMSLVHLESDCLKVSGKTWEHQHNLHYILAREAGRCRPGYCWLHCNLGEAGITYGPVCMAPAL